MRDSTPEPPDWLALADDERIRLRASPSRNLVLAALAVGFVLLLAMSVGVSAMNDVGIGRAVSLTVLVAIVSLLVSAFLLVQRNEYVVTSERVYAGSGLGSKRVTTVDLTDVRDVSIEQSSWQRLLGIGTLRFVAEDVTGEELRFSLVGDPVSLHRRALQVVGAEH